ncbi:MAG: hypothetical protein RLZZ236_2001 [Bacteroidota bacterium]|jgi:type I restriction enzyme S subunit
MKSNYKPLGKYVQLVDERNSKLEDLPLMGLSVSKEFFPTIANLVGTDMKTYKIVYKNQFTYIADTSRRGDKIAIALNDRFNKMLVSQAYTPFEVKDINKLDPEYLMMWFRRPEFDRYARFKSHGSAREIFDWDEMCNTLLPIPNINKQQEIVKEYNIIQKQIELNEQLIQKLEETAQSIYKEWFDGFDFPDENGKPYKSSGGEMIWNEELQKEVPKGWEVTEMQNIIENFDSKRKPIAGIDRQSKEKLYPYYGAAALMDYIDDYIFDGQYILLGEDGTVVTESGTPVLQYVWGKFWVNNHAHVLKGKNGFNENSLYTLLKNTNVTDIITGGVQSKINQSNLNTIPILKASTDILKKYNLILDPIFQLFKNKKDQVVKLKELDNVLLSKLATIE